MLDTTLCERGRARIRVTLLVLSRALSYTTMADPSLGEAYDDDTGLDEDAYDLGGVRRERQAEVITMPSSSSNVVEDSGPAPEWANKWAAEKKKAPKLKGVCASWNEKGFGFIKREEPGAADLYVHQRDLQKKGFRSLLVGEKLEFDVAAMDDGRLHAVRVTGPGGADVQGAPRPSKDSDDEDDAKGGKAAASKAPAKPTFAAAKAFMPRAIAKGPKAKVPLPKPKPKPPES